MTKAIQKITVSPSTDIKLAAEMSRRGLLQSLNMRPALYADGTETGKFEIQTVGSKLCGYW